MSPLATVTGLAIRELWMSFRLFGILLGYVLASFAVALVPSSLAATMGWLAVGLGVAAAAAAMVGAWSVASVRAAGGIRWFRPDDVASAAYVDGWFAGLAIVALIGHILTMGVGWLAALTLSPRSDPFGYVVVVGVAMAGCLATLAIGVAAGTLLPAAAAAAATLVVAVAAALAVVGSIAPAPIVPGAGGFAIVAEFRDGTVDGGAAAVTAGVGLATAAAGLGAARAAVGRVTP